VGHWQQPAPCKGSDRAGAAGKDPSPDVPVAGRWWGAESRSIHLSRHWGVQAREGTRFGEWECW